MTRQTNKKTSFWKNVIKYRALLLMVLPGFIWFIFFFIFQFWPMWLLLKIFIIQQGALWKV